MSFTPVVTTAAPSSARQLVNGVNSTVNTATPNQVAVDVVGGGFALSNTAPVDVDTAAASAGVGITASRTDHKHDVATAVPNTIVPDTAPAEGVSLSLARADHAHGIAADVPNTIVPDTAPAEGVSASFARADHAHGIAAAAPVSIDGTPTNSEGVSTDFARADHHHGMVAALWSTSVMRYFLVDNDAGNDTNLGYVDAAPGATIVPAGLAKRTVAGLMAILPRNGNGRMAKLMFRGRAGGITYVQADTVTLDSLDLSGVSGYAWIGRCGSTDLTNSAADQAQLGAFTWAAGPGVGGVWTAAGGATTQTLDVSAGALPAEGGLTAITGARMRFTGNVTAALTDVCVTIFTNDANTLLYNTLPAAPAAGDTFLIELPGVNFRSFKDIDGAQTFNNPFLPSTGGNMVSPCVGIGTNEVTSPNFGKFYAGGVGTYQYAFCSVRGSTVPAFANFSTPGWVDSLLFTSSYFNEVGTEVLSGGTRIAGNIDIDCQELNINTSGLVSPLSEATAACESTFNVGYMTSAGGSAIRWVLAQGGAFTIANAKALSVIAGLLIFEDSAALGACLRITNESANVAFDDVNARTSGTNPMVLIVNNHVTAANLVRPCYSFDQCVVDDVAAADIFVSFMAARGALAVINAGNNSAGRIRLPAGATATQIDVAVSDLTVTNVIDSDGNEITSNINLRPVVASAVVRNNTEVSINVGRILAADGAIGAIAAVVEARADVEGTADVIGTSITTMAADGFGFACTAGTPYLSTAVSVGLPVFLSTATEGQGTTTEPTTGFKTWLGVSIDANHLTWHPQAPVEILVVDVLGADAEEITFTVDGDVDKAVRVRAWGNCNGGSLVFRLDGSTRTLIWQSCDGAAVTAGSDPEVGGVGFFSADDTISIDLYLNLQRQAGGAGPMGHFTVCREDVAGANPEFVTGQLYSSDGLGNITSVTLRGSIATFFNTGFNSSIERVPPG